MKFGLKESAFKSSFFLITTNSLNVCIYVFNHIEKVNKLQKQKIIMEWGGGSVQNGSTEGVETFALFVGGVFNEKGPQSKLN